MLFSWGRFSRDIFSVKGKQRLVIMEWNNTSHGSNLRPFLTTSPEHPLASLLCYNHFDLQNPPLPATLLGLEVRNRVGFEDYHTSMMIQSTEKNNNRSHTNSSETTDFHNYLCGNNIQDKKKRLSCDQLESLERSFLEEIKLDPDRKMRLARDLGLQPRQIAVWFQNRRARWKNKELERLYDSLKQEYDVVSREKQNLQEEVAKLKALLREHHGMKNQAVHSTGYSEASGEETIESAAAVVNRPPPPTSLTGGRSHHIIEEANYFRSAEDYIPLLVQPSYWQSSDHQLPPYP